MMDDVCYIKFLYVIFFIALLSMKYVLPYIELKSHIADYNFTLSYHGAIEFIQSSDYMSD